MLARERITRKILYPDDKREKKFRRGDELSLSLSLPWFGDAKFSSVGVLTGNISRQCIVAMIRPCSEPSGKRVTVNRIHRERREEGDERGDGKGEGEMCRYHRRVSMPGLPIVLYNTFTLQPIIILYSGCIVFLSGIMFRRHARPRPGA